MRVLFLESHPMWIHGLPNGFRDAGHDVRVSGHLREEKILPLISGFEPDLIFMMGCTAEHTSEKLNWIRRYVKPTNIPLIFWATEDPAYTLSFSLPLIQKILPDYVFTICRERVEYYKKLGIAASHLPFAYHASSHYRTPIDSKYQTSVAVVANAYPHYINSHPDCIRNQSLKILVSPLLKEGIRIDFWGRYWDQMNTIVDFKIPRPWIHGYAPYTETNKIYSSADIVLGLQNSQLTQRTYEILGSEGFLMTSHTLPVRQLFVNGKDLIISSSPEETIKLATYYLNHPQEREKIRQQGKLAVEQHTYKKRAEYIINTLKEQKILPSNILNN